MKVFWSWQSDTPKREGQDFVRDALSKAIDIAGTELDLTDAERPELDSGTKGTKGMVDIAATILTKIAASSVFVADLTPLAETEAGKALPNPNVLIELGWAMHKPGYQYVIAVFNEASGYTVEDLPFDIRGRLVIPYNLSATATKTEFDKQRKELTAALAGAIKTNLADHLDEVAAVTVIQGVAARGDDRSIWETAVQDIEFHEGSSLSPLCKVILKQGPRGYSRIVPASWPKGVPSIATIQALPPNFVVWPATEGGPGGSFGPTEDGFVSFWIQGGAKPAYESGNVVMFFDSTGEYWTLHSSALDYSQGTTYLRVTALLQHWAKTVVRTNNTLDHLGAGKTRKVEVGVTGIKNSHWMGVGQFENAIGRRDAFSYIDQQREWTPDAQRAFLVKAIGGLADIFSLQHPTEAQVAKALGAGWPR